MEFSPSLTQFLPLSQTRKRGRKFLLVGEGKGSVTSPDITQFALLLGWVPHLAFICRVFGSTFLKVCVNED